jgi:hypothetical protein
MLSAVNFIAGSISTSDLIPALKRVNICDNILSACDGIITAKAEFEFPQCGNLECSVDGKKFVAAIKSISSLESFSLEQTKSNLIIKSNNFKAYLPIDDYIEHSLPALDVSNTIEIKNSDFKEALKSLTPFIAVDGQTYWAGGVLLKGSSLFATDSKTLIQKKLPFKAPINIVIPFQAVKEILRNKEDITSIIFNEKILRIQYDASRFLDISTIDADWPPIEKLLNDTDYSNCKTIPSYFFDDISKLKKFVGEENSLYILNGCLRTSSNKKTGAVIKGAPKCKALFDIDQILNLKGVATKIDFSKWPNNVPFLGHKLRGILSGKQWKTI